VSKGGFYWHFADRPALIAEMLGTWEKTGTQDIIARADNRRMDFVRSLFRPFCADEDDVEVRSMTSYWMVIGSYFVAADHGSKTRPEVLRLAIDRLLR
jgi:AcrR family transcriptional regulator